MTRSKINTRLVSALLVEDGMSQLQLANELGQFADGLGLDPSLVSKMIRGGELPSQQFMELAAEVMELIAAYWGVSVEALF